MEHKNLSPKNLQILGLLTSLPKNILSMHGHENVSEFVLHDLCKPECFNLKYAAYFIDNPDFDCCKGIAGFAQEEKYQDDSVWKNPESFSEFMKRSAFNQKVRKVSRPSYRRCNGCEGEIVKELAGNLGMTNPEFFSWDLKHDNHGIVIFEQVPTNNHQLDDYLHGLCLLGFCPIH